MPGSRTASLRTPRHLIFAFAMLILAMVGIDQTTKFHAEKNFLHWSHPTEVHHMNTNKQHVFTLGNSPSEIFKKGASPNQITSSWLDFHLTYVRNTGAAWGALSSMPRSFRTPFFTIVTIIALSIVAWLFTSSHPGQRFYRVGLICIFAGAVGNFVDRLALGYVIDWLQFHWKVFGWEYSFPVFNLADVFINVGVGVILIDLLLTEIQMRKLAIQNEANQ
jgi:signal peptidase II